jgi:hypothetical protein
VTAESEWPEQWLSVVDDTLDKWWADKTLDVWPDFMQIAPGVLAALDRIGALNRPQQPTS